MNQSAHTATEIDAARHALCQLIVQACEAGGGHSRVRINSANNAAASVWVYTHRDDAWNKLPQSIDDQRQAALIADEMKRLASVGHTDEFSVHRHDYADRIEVDLRFHANVIDSHRGPNLSSYLFGRLFYEPHGSSQDRREAIRRGPRTGG